MTRARALELYAGRGEPPAVVARNYRAAMQRARAGARWRMAEHCPSKQVRR